MKRRIESFDEEQLKEVHLLMKGEWWCADRTLDEVCEVVARSDLTLAYLDKDGSIAAFSRALTDQVFKAVLFDVIVRTDHRDSGLGRELLLHTVEHKMLKSVKSIELYCPDRISSFYTKLGFEVSDSKLHRLRRD